ncbi:ABC transporter ATP-binding protein [Roseibium algae]|uniref:ABC transporter ATP-binding protein n=1 Tax=Roseibium algae TaxID=3123038 RepID=A0ABU8TFF1_9HYPH
MTSKTEPVLRIENLQISLPEGADRPFAVDGVSYELNAGEILCIVGESGSGKSMSANAMMGLLPDMVRPTAGQIIYGGKDLLTLSEPELLDLRGRKIAMIFQEPMSALNPLMRIEDQIVEVFEAHGLLTIKERKLRALNLLIEVGIPDPEKALRAYPFQLSGGQRQRVMIAMALALEPDVLIADEPTTALDVTTQAQILDLIHDLRERHGMAVMFITHDFGVVAEIADRVAVMQFGKIVEHGNTDDVLDNPQHEYTRKLIAAIPKLHAEKQDDASRQTPVLEVTDLCKTYRSGGGFFGGPERVVKAVQMINLELAAGETLGIVGESGSGKSSVGRCLVRLMEPDSGSVFLAGEDMAKLKGEKLRAARKSIQMIFQDPFASLNPRTKVGRIIAEGPIAHGVPKSEAFSKAVELLELVGLDQSAIDRYPHEFSGGQRQRIGIARALALEPSVIIADEAVSALDVSIQAQVLDLLADLKQRLNLALVFITHDLRVAAQICDRIAVMQQGKIVEIGTAHDVFNAPTSAYTKSLIEAIPGREKELAAAS